MFRPPRHATFTVGNKPERGCRRRRSTRPRRLTTAAKPFPAPLAGFIHAAPMSASSPAPQPPSRNVTMLQLDDSALARLMIAASAIAPAARDRSGHAPPRGSAARNNHRPRLVNDFAPSVRSQTGGPKTPGSPGRARSPRQNPLRRRRLRASPHDRGRCRQHPQLGDPSAIRAARRSALGDVMPAPAGGQCIATSSNPVTEPQLPAATAASV